MDVQAGTRTLMKSYVWKVIVVVVFLNLLQLALFLFKNVSPTIANDVRSYTGEKTAQVKVAKLFPSVPSYRTWLADFTELPPPHTCEGHFGNGFVRKFPIFEAKGDSGSVDCHYSPTLKTSVCEGKRVVLHPERIRMTIGGESLDSVVGRDEDEEIPIFSDGAFELQVPKDDSRVGSAVFKHDLLDTLITKGQVNHHTVRSLLQSMRTVSSSHVTCSQIIKETTLFVTRFEYANLFHTVTDWYSSYASCRVVGLDHRPNVVLLDGHCQSPMDDGWESFFSNVTYGKHFPENTCFEHAIFVPLGYETALFKGLASGLPCYGSSPIVAVTDPSKTSRLREFGEVFSASVAGTADDDDGDGDNDEIKILLIRREDYLAHPRHSGKPETRLSNEEEVYERVKEWSLRRNEGRKIKVVNGLFGHMRLSEQLKAVKAARVIIGVHGAGLTHIVFAKASSVVLEILSPLFMRPHYQFISQWMGIKYHSIVMEGVTVNCDEVIESLNQIINNIQ